MTGENRNINSSLWSPRQQQESRQHLEGLPFAVESRFAVVERRLSVNKITSIVKDGQQFQLCKCMSLYKAKSIG